MENQKINRLLCVFSWFGVLMSTILEFYMLHLVKEYPDIEAFARNSRIVGVLLLVWLAVSAYFTVRAVKGGKK